MEDFEIIEDFVEYREYMDIVPNLEDGWKKEYEDIDIDPNFIGKCD